MNMLEGHHVQVDAKLHSCIPNLDQTIYLTICSLTVHLPILVLRDTTIPTSYETYPDVGL